MKCAKVVNKQLREHLSWNNFSCDNYHNFKVVKTCQTAPLEKTKIHFSLSTINLYIDLRSPDYKQTGI